MTGIAERKMRIEVDEIGAEGHCVETTVSKEDLIAILAMQGIYRPTAPGSLQVKLFRADEMVYIQGQVEVEVQAQCSRCLDGVTENPTLSLRVNMFPEGQLPASDADGEVKVDMSDGATYRNGEIDLIEIVRDELVLELPTNPVCRKSCAGLCAECGNNLNHEACSCTPVGDIRWAGLRNLDLKVD